MLTTITSMSSIDSETEENNCIGINKKRISLLFTIPGTYYIIATPDRLPIDSIIIFIDAVIIYYNFPLLVTYNSTKPLYYEDLFVDRNKIPSLDIDINTKQTFKNYFTWFLIFTNSLLTTGLYNYWLFKTQGSNSFYEIIGITGGILKIFQMINHYSAISALYLIKKSIRSKIYTENDNDDDAQII
jgi:hypothetical protein